MDSKILCAFLILSIALTVSALQCEVDFCSRVRCANANQEMCDAKNMIFKEHGSVCGCCNVCLTKLNKGDSCISLLLVGGPPPTAACAAGLTCDRTTHTCV